MNDQVEQLAITIQNFSWPEKREQRRSQANLMREYLRRAAWISESYDTPWPFYDFAYAVDPNIRANENIIDPTIESVPYVLHFFVRHTCEWALHFKKLEHTNSFNSNFANPFDPLMLMYSRGNSFSANKAGFIEVDFIGIPKRMRKDHLISEPLAPLEESKLDLMDKSEP